LARKILTKLARSLDTQELRYCYNSSFRSYGDLSEWLYQARHWDDWADTKAILVEEDGIFLGWGLRRSDGEVGFWTRREARGKGIGMAMVKRAAKLGNIITHPHDEPSRALFRKAARIVPTEVALVDYKQDFLEDVSIELKTLGRKTKLSLDSERYGDHLLQVLAKE
jgi:GNAT superfamily N-acetyltransferase